MPIARYCDRRSFIVAGRLVFIASLLVVALQMTYLHIYKDNERKLDHTDVLTHSPDKVMEQSPDKVMEQSPDKVMEQSPDKITSAAKPLATCANVPPLIYNPDLYFKPPYQPRVHGTPREGKGFLTIGIPSVQRPNTDRIYLYETLDSIIGKMPKVEHHQITIVILVSDANSTYNRKLSSRIYERYQTYCDEGLIHVIKASECIYPDLENVKQTYNDTHARLIWRAKQNIDYAFLMLYCRDVSDFYIQLEDDVIVATDFIQDIRSLIQNITQRWFILEFSRLGFIGKLFRSTDLEFVSKYLLHNYDLAPGDLLLGHMRVEKGQSKPVHSNNSLFQHIGRFSSLKNKLMPSLDNTFKDVLKLDSSLDVPVGDNPVAFINTSLTEYNEYIPEHAYDNDTSTYFWGKTPMKNDHFTLIFSEPQNFSRIIIPTGAAGTKKDSFLYSNLMFSEFTKTQAFTNAISCLSRFVKLASLVDGDIDTMATGTAIPSNIKCLRITAMRKLSHWVIIRDIQLFVK